MTVKVAQLSHPGMKRLQNEDSINVAWNQKNHALSILCDGVGGHQSGEVASQMAVTHLSELWQREAIDTPQDAIEWLTTHIADINAQIHDRANRFEGLKGMSTTLVCAVIIGNKLIVAHVGDSRLYVFRSPEFRQITSDHTIVNDLLELGGLSEEEARNHPMKNVITRAIGNKETVEVDMTSVTLQDDDYILLCSDGLTDMLSDEAILESFNEWYTLENRTKLLVHKANLVGGKDNISVIIAHYKEDNIEKGEGQLDD